jgi:hypothetical protein
MTKDQLFREPPPQELILSFLESCGFSSLEDSREFQKSDLTLAAITVSEWHLPQLEPYYYPCKANLYIKKKQTPESLLVILRHLLRLEGYKLYSSEKQRQIIYSIQKDIHDLRWKPESCEVSFS